MATAIGSSFFSKRGGVWQKVSAYPSGYKDDGGITGATLDGQPHIRTKKGAHSASEVGLFTDGVDKTARLITVFADPAVKTVEFNEPGPVVINGTVNIPAGKTLRFYDGAQLSGTGTVTGFRLDAQYTSQLVATGSTLTFQPASFAGRSISPAWWGFKPNTGTDQSPFLQKAVNLAANSDKVKNVFVPEAGTYNVKNIVFMKSPGSANSLQTTLSIEGAAQSSGQGVVFQNTDRQSATLHLQQVLGCTIKNICFDGGLPYQQNFLTGDWSYGGTVRTNGKSPFCAISIDQIFTGGGSVITPGDYYPGLDPALYNNTHYSGSTNVKIEDCVFTNMYVAIAAGLSGCPNGENVRVSGGFSANICCFWAAGQLQSRENTIEKVWFYNGDTFISNVNFGNGLGDLPAVNNCNLNNLKYLFQAQGDFTTVRFSGGYSEAMWSLGKSTSNCPVIFKNWNYTVLSPGFDSIAVGASPIFVETRGGFSWDGGKIEGTDYKSGFPLNCGNASFSNVFIRGAVPFQTNQNYFDKISFNNVQFTGYGGTEPIWLNENDRSLVGVVDDEATLNGRYLLPGSKIKTRGNRTFENVGSKIDRIPVGAYAVTIAAPLTLSFTPDNVGRFAYGDQLVCEEAVNFGQDVYAPSSTSLGYVSNITGGVVTVSHIPAGLVNGGVYNMFIARVPFYITRTIGITAAGSPVITGILKDNPNYTTFRQGDHIKGDGIPFGARVQSFTATTITMTLPASASATRVELYDAKTKVTTDNKTFSFFGAPYQIFNLEWVWFKGDEIFNLTGANFKSYYCTVAGKYGDATYGAGFITDGPGAQGIQGIQGIQGPPGNDGAAGSEGTDTFTLSPAGFRAVTVGKLVTRLQLKPTANMTVNIGLTDGGTEEADGIDLVAGQTTIFIPSKRAADSVITYYFSGASGGVLEVKIKTIDL